MNMRTLLFASLVLIAAIPAVAQEPVVGKADESLAQLKGLAAFVHMTDPKRGRRFLERIAALEAAGSV